MLRFLLRRLLVAVPTLLLVVTIAFFMMRAAPGGPFDTNRKLPAQVEHNLKARYGLDQPLGVQYLRYLDGIFHGDLGPSLKYPDRSVLDVIHEGFPTSLRLGLSALILGVIAGLGLGVAGALRRNSAGDHVVTGLAILGICIPTFVTGPLLVLVFASWLGWLPTGGLSDAQGYVLPVTVLALPQIAIITRLTRSGMIEALSANAVRTARARGLPERSVVLNHALRAAVSPLVSYLGPAAAGLITGSLVVEKIFTLPGLGKAFVNGALERDYTVVMGVVILYASLVIGLNLLAELIQSWLDPRIRLS